MTKRLILFSCVVSSIILASCKKEKEETYCWQIIDDLGNDIMLICNRTQGQMQSEYPNACHYYQVGENFCWLADGNTYIENRPEGFIELMQNCFGLGTATKVTCGYCTNYYTREKHLYKPNNTFTFSPIRFQQYCGDTVQTLFHGRIVVLRESPDSLITVQFSNNGTF